MAKIPAIEIVDNDDRPLTFGKYKGTAPKEIISYDPGYIVWMCDNVDKTLCSNELYWDACDMEVEKTFKTKLNGTFDIMDDDDIPLNNFW